ncbi:MAG TPA: DUF3857 domain-containing protein [Fluviicola sp.]|nr:DUF3857 domain-containing protein [Fluviicola sp.]
MKLTLLIVLLLTAGNCFSQGFYENYDWEKSPKKYAFSEDELLEDEIIVYEKRSVELVGETEMVQFNLLHTITLLNTDAAIENNNKMYVPSGSEANIKTLKARVIKPDGKIIELDREDIQESKDEEGYVQYRYFAFDGIEKGSYIEYIHYIERGPVFSGSVMTLESGTLKKEVDLDIICPKSLEYQIHPINGMPRFVSDSTARVRRMFLHVTDVAGVKDEDWSPYEASLKKAYFKVDRNTETGASDFYTYENITKIIHRNMYEQPSKKAQKAMAKFISSTGVPEDAPLEDRIRALENKLKSEIGIIEGEFEGSFDIELMLSKKLTNEEGMTKLMLQLLREMNVKHEFVLTSDKTENPFLSDYEAYNFLEEYLIYINELDLFMSPDLVSRLGFPPFYLTNTKGLFIKEIKLNDLVTAVGKIKDIHGTKSEQSMDQITIGVQFNEDLSDCSISLERKVTGYKAQFPQAILNLMDQEAKKKECTDFLLYFDEDAKLQNEVYENDNSDLMGVKPFIGRATMNGASFMEKGGDKTLLKVGLLIGPQAELYNQEERKLPVESGYQREYNRTITITIPDGQTVKNPEELAISVTPDAAGNSCGFISTYELKGNQLIVTVREYYKRTSYTVEEYPLYEKVMNAAADFNKIVLVFDKLPQ